MIPDIIQSGAEQEFLQRFSGLHSYLGAVLPLPRVAACESVRAICGWGNTWNLYRSQSSYSGKPCLTRYSPAEPYKIVTIEEFWSDAIDNAEFGADYDFSRPFFDQFNELMLRIYHLPLSATNIENSDYVNGALNLKDCYLCFAASDSQGCLYCHELRSGESNIDCIATKRCRFCYAGASLDNCYECRSCVDCWDSAGCFGCSGCHSVTDCIGCVGLTQARHCIFNQQKSADEYRQFLIEHRLASYSGTQRLLQLCYEFAATVKTAPNRIINAENCSGDYIGRSQNLYHCYNVFDAKDCGYLVDSMSCFDSWRGVSVKSELCWNSLSVQSQNIAYSYAMWLSENIFYSYMLFNRCAHCFGCASLKAKSYCILNRQYSKEEYFEILPRIVRHMQATGEWGQLLPPRISPHGYQESYAFDTLPELSNKEASARGYRLWTEPQSAAGKTDLSAAELPDELTSADLQHLSGKSIACAESGAPFNLQRAELEFYLRQGIPAPRVHWRRRLRQIMKQRARMPEEVDCKVPRFA